MLREYRLTNFKAFGDTVTVPIRPAHVDFRSKLVRQEFDLPVAAALKADA